MKISKNYKIQFVYFDLGGVVIQDFSGTNKWDELRSAIGISPKNRVAFDAIWARHKDRLGIDYDVDWYIPEIEKECGISFPKNFSLLNEFVKRFEQNESIWPILETIHTAHRIGLLTNMYPRMLDAIKKRDILPSTQWDVVVDSSIVGYQKPDPKIFEIAQKMADVDKSEILFVENSIENIHAAETLGWNTYHYDSSNIKESNARLVNLL